MAARVPNVDALTALRVALSHAIEREHPAIAAMIAAGANVAWHLLPKDVVTKAATICAELDLTESEMLRIFRGLFRGVPSPIEVGKDFAVVRKANLPL
jgi:hypothetical protein